MKKRHFSSEERIKLLDDYVDSNLSVKEYTVLKNIGYSTFQGWLGNRKKTEGTTNDERFHQQSYDTANSTIPFIDITPHHRTHTTRPCAENLAEGLNLQEKTSSVFITSPTSMLHNGTTTKRSAQRAPSSSSSISPNQLDVLLPNGISMTLHETSFDERVSLIKALV